MKTEQWVRFCDKAMAFSFYALIYFVPISIALVETFSNTALVAYLARRTIILVSGIKQGTVPWKSVSFPGQWGIFFRAYKPISNALNRPVTVLLIVSFVSVLLSQYHWVSFKGFMGKSLQNAFIFFTFIECVNSKDRLKKFLTVFFISVTVVSLSGLYQSIFGRDLIFGQVAYDTRINSSLRAPNDFGAYLILVIPILLSLTVFPSWEKKAGSWNGFSTFFRKPATKMWLLALVLLVIYDLGLTSSRGAWLGFLVSLICFGIFNRQALKIFGLIAACLVIFGIISQSSRFDFKDVDRLFIDNGRLYYWKEAGHIIQNNPLFGVGLNAYSLVGRDYKINWGGYPHNCYLQMAAETGIIGLGVFLWMLVALFYDSYKNSRIMSDPALRLLLAGFSTGLCGFLVHSFFDTVLYSVQLSALMWIFLGAIIAIQLIAKNQRNTV